MEYFDFYCPLCNQKLKVPLVNNGVICNCPFCDGEIVPVEQAERERKALEQAERARNSERKRKQKMDAQASAQVSLKTLDYFETAPPLITILKIVIVLNIIAGIICFMASICLKEPWLFCAAIALASESVILYGIIKFLELIQQHFINTFWIKEHLAEISHKLDK